MSSLKSKSHRSLKDKQKPDEPSAGARPTHRVSLLLQHANLYTGCSVQQTAL